MVLLRVQIEKTKLILIELRENLHNYVKRWVKLNFNIHREKCFSLQESAENSEKMPELFKREE